MLDSADRPVLVTGAGGFLGSHVVKRLLADRRKVRVFVRHTTNVEGIAGLPVEWHYGDITDPAAVERAVSGCGSIIHCVVNTQAWLRDPAPMYRVNVEGLINVMDAALAHDVRRFVMTSTIATVGLNKAGVSTEEDTFNYADRAGPYVRCRVEAERRFFEYVHNRGLPGIAMNVANTYGAGDFALTPHGWLLCAVMFGDAPFTINAGLACVGITDAADAMVLAEQKGRVGERYIVSEKWLEQRRLYEIAIAQAGTNVKLRTLPLPLLYIIGFVSDLVARVRKRESQLSVESVRLSHIMNDMDSSRARRELGWQPAPVEDSIRAAAAFYQARRSTQAGNLTKEANG